MKCYELAYETDEKKCLIIPHLLNEDQPAELPIFQIGESLMLRYKAEQPLPPDTISRFIVKHNEEIKKGKKENSWVWRYGVVLHDGNDTIALIREENRTISVSVKGKNQTDYLDKLRKTLNGIFKSYKSKKPELQYRVQRFGEIRGDFENENALWLPDSRIYNHYINNRPYYDDSSGRDLPIQPVVKIYNITAENLIMDGQGNRIESVRNTFNFRNCNINLQGNLNDLASSLKNNGEIEEAKALEDAANALSEAEQCKTPEEVKKKGIVSKLKRIVEDLGNEKSELHKAVKRIKYGIEVAQKIAKGYNDIAQWVGLL